ncbi:MAG: ferrous iron transport protein A [Promethearchaeota archaeon]
MKTEFKPNSSRKSVNDTPYKRLTECPLGQKVKVVRVDAGYQAKRRLSCLGIVPGVEIIKKKAAPFRGPVEIIVKGTSLVIGRGLASKIIVK